MTKSQGERLGGVLFIPRLFVDEGARVGKFTQGMVFFSTSRRWGRGDRETAVWARILTSNGTRFVGNGCKTGKFRGRSFLMSTEIPNPAPLSEPLLSKKR